MACGVTVWGAGSRGRGFCAVLHDLLGSPEHRGDLTTYEPLSLPHVPTGPPPVNTCPLSPGAVMAGDTHTRAHTQTPPHAGGLPHRAHLRKPLLRQTRVTGNCNRTAGRRELPTHHPCSSRGLRSRSGQRGAPAPAGRPQQDRCRRLLPAGVENKPHADLTTGPDSWGRVSWQPPRGTAELPEGLSVIRPDSHGCKMPIPTHTRILRGAGGGRECVCGPACSSGPTGAHSSPCTTVSSWCELPAPEGSALGLGCRESASQ